VVSCHSGDATSSSVVTVDQHLIRFAIWLPPEL